MKKVKSTYVRKPPPWWSGPWIVAGAAILILLVIGGIAVLATLRSNSPTAPRNDAAVINQTSHVSANVFDQVTPASNSIHPTSGSLIKTPDGKIKVLYIGSEACPYCAAERWSLVAALSRFGSFKGLALTSSASNDVYPNTPTFTFLHSSYSSDSISFDSVELADHNGQPLQTPSPADQKLLDTYGKDGGTPFLLIGGKYGGSGSGYLPDLIQGKSWDQIAGGLSNSSATSTKGIIGEANMLSAAICQTNGGQPLSVCQSTAVKQAIPILNKNKGSS
ncbi:MAG: DUF929 family protein [Candidatus Dormibacteraceae bacterium]